MELSQNNFYLLLLLLITIDLFWFGDFTTYKYSNISIYLYLLYLLCVY